MLFKMPSGDPPALSIAGLGGLACLLATAVLTAVHLSGWSLWVVLGLLAASAVAIFMATRQDGTGSTMLDEVVRILRSTQAQQLDLSQQISEPKGRRQREFAQLFNAFMERLRSTFEELQQRNLAIGLAAGQGRYLSENANKDASKQDEYSELVFRSSEQTAHALGEVSERANELTMTNSSNLESARSSLVQLRKVVDQIAEVTDSLREFGGTVEQLVTTSEDIRGILATVEGFATQTNMLALNAAIEASRAGEHGRGFAVVAEEVRGLAGKVRTAAEQINELVEAMSTAVGRTANTTGAVIEQADAARSAISEAAGQFERMVSDFQQNHDALLQVGSAIEELSVTNEESHRRSTEIRELAARIGQQMQLSFKHADTLRDTTNLSLQELSRFRIGRGKLEPIMDLLIKRRDTIQAVMEKLAAEGVDLFDENYRPHPVSKYHFETNYIQPLRDACQALIDQFSAEDSQYTLYYGLTTDNGYTPLLPSSASQPPTGDPRKDAVNSQALTFTVSDDVQLNNLRRAEYVGMGSFVLPNGFILFATYAPIFIGGRRWGTLTGGIAPQVFGLSPK